MSQSECGSQRTTPRNNFSVLEELQCLGCSHPEENVPFKAFPVTLSIHQDVPSAFSNLNKWTNVAWMAMGAVGSAKSLSLQMKVRSL